jgi:hypothetical protein
MAVAALPLSLARRRLTAPVILGGALVAFWILAALTVQWWPLGRSGIPSSRRDSG